MKKDLKLKDITAESRLFTTDNKNKAKYINEYIKTSILYNGIEKTEIEKTTNMIKRILKKVKFLTSKIK